MATYYEGTPPFEERIQGAPLIINGRVEEVVDTKTDYSGEEPQVQTVFRVEVENVMKGELGESSIYVRVVGGQAEKAQTKWTVQMKKGDEVLLMLAPDYSPEGAKDAYVPYFSSGYPVTEKGQVKLDQATAEELTRQDIKVQRAAASLSDLRSEITAVLKEREKHEARLSEMESAELREAPYGEVEEIPGAGPGEARSTSPEGNPEERE